MSAVLVARREAQQRAEAKKAQPSERPALTGTCLDCGDPAEVSICRPCLTQRGA